MIVAIGSVRGPKVEAVRRALGTLKERFPDYIKEDLRLIARTTPSGTSATPKSTRELMAGARYRAHTLFDTLSAEGQIPTLALGLEGGVVSETELDGNGSVYLLESWAYATDGTHGHFGSSGCIPLPEGLAAAVIARGEDLGPVADRVYGEHDVAGRQGTFGILTGEIITREEAFLRATLHALAPFYNSSAYGIPAPGESLEAETPENQRYG